MLEQASPRQPPPHRMATRWIVMLSTSLVARPVMGQTKPEEPDLAAVRAALEKYKDPYVAIHDGYFSTLGCVEIAVPELPGTCLTSRGDGRALPQRPPPSGPYPIPRSRRCCCTSRTATS